MQHPPRLVKLVMKAICILLDIEPQEKTKKDGTKKMSYWKAATSTLCLADPNLPERLERFDRAGVSREKMDMIEELMSDPDYSHQAIKKASFAAESLYNWVKALRDYHYIAKELEPRKEALQAAEERFEKAQFQSEDKRQEIEGYEKALEEMRAYIADRKKEAEELAAVIEDKI